MKKPTRSQLVKKLDKVFSEYIRRKDADAFGMTSCCTCGKKDHWKNLQNGHYISRSVYSTRWDEVNCSVQCSACNVFKGGVKDVHALYLMSVYGPSVLLELGRKKQHLVKLSNATLQSMIDHYKDELDKLTQ